MRKYLIALILLLYSTRLPAQSSQPWQFPGGGSGGGITQVSSLPPLPCTNNTVFQLTVAPFGIYTCVNGSFINSGPSGNDFVADSYGVKHNGIVITTGSQFTITSGSSNFTITGGPGLTQADVGKFIWATTWTGGDSTYTTSAACMTTASPTTIATVTSGTTGTLSQNATGNCGTTNTNNGALAYVTDDTAAWHAIKVAALDAINCSGVRGSGITVITNAEFNTSACQGTGVGSTASHYGGVYGAALNSQLQFLIPPWFNLTTCTGGVSGNVCFGEAPSTAWANVTFNGLGVNTLAGTGSKILFGTSIDGAYQNLIFEGICASSSNCGASNPLIGFQTLGGAHVHINIIVDGINTPCSINTNTYSGYAWFCGNGGGANQLNILGGVTFECFACGYVPVGSTTGQIVNVGNAATYLEDEGVYTPSTNASAALACTTASIVRLKNSIINNVTNSGSDAINMTGTCKVATSSSFLVGGSSGGAVVMSATGSYLDDTHTTYSSPSGIAPTCTVTGAGTTATCAIDTGSSAERGTMVITSAGTGQAALGTIVLTYGQTFQINGQPPACTWTLDNTGNTAWSPRATLIVNAKSTTAETVNWDNNAVALVATNTLKAGYECNPR